MRLSAEQTEAIRAAARSAFGEDAVVRLFGSRTRDDALGGDIDLHVEAAPERADLDHEVLFRAALWKMLDEPQVDVVVTARGAPLRWIDTAALREGIVL